MWAYFRSFPRFVRGRSNPAWEAHTRRNISPHCPHRDGATWSQWSSRHLLTPRHNLPLIQVLRARLRTHCYKMHRGQRTRRLRRHEIKNDRCYPDHRFCPVVIGPASLHGHQSQFGPLTRAWRARIIASLASPLPSKNGSGTGKSRLTHGSGHVTPGGSGPLANILKCFQNSTKLAWTAYAMYSEVDRPSAALSGKWTGTTPQSSYNTTWPVRIDSQPKARRCSHLISIGASPKLRRTEVSAYHEDAARIVHLLSEPSMLALI